MSDHSPHISERAAHREAVERIIARYPDIDDDELYSLLNYFRREALARDRAIIASKAEIRRQYRHLSHDYSLGRLKMVEGAVAVAFVVLLTLVLGLVIAGVWE